MQPSYRLNTGILKEVKMYQHSCERIIDEENNLDCGKPARNTVLIRGHTGKVKVWVCDQHYAEHNRAAAKQRAATKR